MTGDGLDPGRELGRNPGVLSLSALPGRRLVPRWDLIGAVAAALLVSSPALACKGKQILLEDNFTTTDPAWPPDNEIATGNSAFRLTPNRGEFYVALYAGLDFEDVDVCV